MASSIAPLAPGSYATLSNIFSALPSSSTAGAPYQPSPATTPMGPCEETTLWIWCSRSLSSNWFHVDTSGLGEQQNRWPAQDILLGLWATGHLNVFSSNILPQHGPCAHSKRRARVAYVFAEQARVSSTFSRLSSEQTPAWYSSMQPQLMNCTRSPCSSPPLDRGLWQGPKVPHGKPHWQ